MSTNLSDFSTLLQRVRDGCPQAAEQFTRLYGPHILTVIRMRLKARPALRQIFDSHDFTQDVWSAFFSRWVHERDFQTPEPLIAFLRRAAASQVRDKVRQFLHARKHDLMRNKPLYHPPMSLNWKALAVPGPGPDHVVMAREEWEQFLDRQPPVYRAVLVMLAEGHVSADVARRLGVSEKTVLRVRQRLTTALGRPDEDEGQDAER
jgi:DNA-directed RNA polymerase specialized sigma24 family protein